MYDIRSSSKFLIGPEPEVNPCIRTRSYLLAILVGMTLGLPSRAFAQIGGLSSGPTGGMIRTTERMATVEVFLKGPDGQKLMRSAVVTLIRESGQFFRTGATRNGRVRLEEVAPTEYNLRIVASGYSTITKKIEVKEAADVKLTFQLEANAEGIDAITDKEMAALGTKGQKEVQRAIEAIRSNRRQEARAALQKASGIAPQSAEVQYLLGVCEQKEGRADQAKSYFTKALAAEPLHYRALISISEVLLHEDRAKDATPYVERAASVEPTAWRPHALYAEVYLKEGSNEEAIEQAKRAQELGHGKAATVQPIIAAALFKQGEKEKAVETVQDYLKEHPADAQAKRLLTAFQSSGVSSQAVIDLVSGGTETDDALPSSWMPQDIDEKVGNIEAGSACALDEVLKSVEMRVEEFVNNVGRFTASETMQHESINKWGAAGSTIGKKFDYLVSMSEVQPGFFSVLEYRTNGDGTVEFPEGITTSGLPAMILIFHQDNAANFEFTCEGLTNWNRGKAWQVHFRQRPDRPNTIRSYRFGPLGKVYPVNLKGRAWIAADTFQVERMETQMVAPVKEINLQADYTSIEYGPVHFKARNEDLWLPQTAEVYSAWKGHRFHRTHSFSSYALFSIEDKQTISDPKSKATVTPRPAGQVSEKNR